MKRQNFRWIYIFVEMNDFSDYGIEMSVINDEIPI